VQNDGGGGFIETIANEGDCFMEAHGGLVENVRNKGDELKSHNL
jgi:hypothetical protein